ncbi:uncharacterized protein BJ212DRAFT_1296311 [Suillus subaureus]|uniref:CHAT domain-containing protein n=1 Tax=Suillus subaureus TaxID=48587 RepID=A0A9P7JI86_9AGAM|nr:uncharacterized protein BJ212DRAFT_1296311 [Suillus subaureus]KAG1823754.1 hypothetical protein BJ212DRAFT_1296311 [Suillus subaureus]
MENNAPQAEFAFLSACHTVASDKETRDEVIHSAAERLGTLWAVDDAVANLVVKAFYEDMFKDLKEGIMNCTEAALAPNHGTAAVKKQVPLEQRIIFIHVVMLLVSNDHPVCCGEIIGIYLRSAASSSCTQVLERSDFKPPCTFFCPSERAKYHQRNRRVDGHHRNVHRALLESFLGSDAKGDEDGRSSKNTLSTYLPNHETPFGDSIKNFAGDIPPLVSVGTSNSVATLERVA